MEVKVGGLSPENMEGHYKIENKCLIIDEGIRVIPENGFLCREDFEAIRFPEGVEEIGREAFRGCGHLKCVDLPASLKTLGKEAFGYCSCLQDIRFPDGLEEIPEDCCKSCEKLKRVKFGAGLKTIGEDAFYYCKNLEAIEFPTSLKKIEKRAFAYCNSLRSVKILDNIEVIETETFQGCESLATVETDGLHFAPFEKDVFLDTPYLSEARKRNPLVVIDDCLVDGRTAKGDVVLPEGLVQICNSAFLNCTEITSVMIPDTVKLISPSAFEGCTSLKKVSIPQGQMYVLDHIFYDCVSLEEVKLPPLGDVWVGEQPFGNTPWQRAQEVDNQPLVIGEYISDGTFCKGSVRISGAKHIAEAAFKDNYDVTEVVIEDGVESIERHAFEECINLKRVTLPSTLKELKPYAFSGCRSLEVIVIPEGVTGIGFDAFRYCVSLKRVVLPQSLEWIGDYAFKGCPNLERPVISDHVKLYKGVFDSGGDFYEWFPTAITAKCVGDKVAGKAYYRRPDIVEVTIPEGVKRIGDCAFCACWNLRTVHLPDSLEEIGHEAFSHSGVRNINFPKNLKTISSNAFEYNNGLNVVELPDGLSFIESEAFRGTKIERLTLPSSVEHIGDRAFCGCERLVEVVADCDPDSVGYGVFDDCFRLRSFQTDCFPIDPEMFEDCPLMGAETVEDERFTIRFGTLMEVKCELSEVVEIPDGVHAIGPKAFLDHKEIKEVRLPDSLRSIAESVFCGCSQLEKINFPRELKKISSSVFEGCAFQSIDWPASVAVIPACAFRGCHSLKEVHIPDTVEFVWDGAFEGCAIREVRLPKSIVSFGNLTDASNHRLSDEYMGKYDPVESEEMAVIVENEEIWIDRSASQNYFSNVKDLPIQQTLLWRGDIRQSDDYEVRFKLLNDFCRGLELGFDYGEKVTKRNERMIRKLNRGYSPLRRMLLYVWTTILWVVNIILHIVLFPYVYVKALGHMWSTSGIEHEYLLDGLVHKFGNKLAIDKMYVWSMRDSGLRFLMAKGWLKKSVAKEILSTEVHTRFTYPFSRLELRVRRYSKELYEELEKYVKG